MERQLAAIMFTDIVGYTALMGKDEERAFQLLRKNRTIQKPLIQRYGGTWLKEIGDGILSSFNTVSQAVLCALEIQHTCCDQDDLKLRIGIHEGEVVFEDHDAFGDGVNIASRLQTLAPAGKIWVSESVHKNVLNKKEIETRFVTEKNLKNVREPVRIFEVNDPESEASHPRVVWNYQLREWSRTFWALVPSLAVLCLVYLQFGYHQHSIPIGETQADQVIAVLPFSHDDEGADTDLLALGLHDDLLTQISKIGSIKMVPGELSLTLENSAKSIPEIGEELGATVVLTGVVQIEQNEIRIKVHLLNVSTGEAIWVENYVGQCNSSNIIGIQREITLGVAETLNVDLFLDDLRRLENIPTKHLNLYEKHWTDRRLAGSMP